ncbi:MAG: hypothetical protein RR703_00985 [Bacilli bacterium]|uniref:hypothetical protein n=1 Tax=Carnobacterium sp. TaxID=48221 RepID=UPI002FC7D528
MEKNKQKKYSLVIVDEKNNGILVPFTNNKQTNKNNFKYPLQVIDNYTINYNNMKDYIIDNKETILAISSELGVLYDYHFIAKDMFIICKTKTGDYFEPKRVLFKYMHDFKEICNDGDIKDDKFNCFFEYLKEKIADEKFFKKYVNKKYINNTMIGSISAYKFSDPSECDTWLNERNLKQKFVDRGVIRYSYVRDFASLMYADDKQIDLKWNYEEKFRIANNLNILNTSIKANQSLSPLNTYKEEIQKTSNLAENSLFTLENGEYKPSIFVDEKIIVKEELNQLKKIRAEINQNSDHMQNVLDYYKKFPDKIPTMEKTIK